MIPDTRSDPEARLMHLPRGPVAVTDVGTGPPIVAIHGVPGTVRDWRYLGAVIEGPLRVIRLDLPGFGATPLTDPRDLSAKGFARAVVGVMDALDLGRVVLLGHSFGGIVATAIAAEHPDRVAGLALLATPGRRVHRGGRSVLRIRPMVSALSKVPGGKVVLGPALRSAFGTAGFSPSISDEARLRSILVIDRATLEQHRDHLERVRAPSLVAWSEDDRLVDADIVADVAELLPAGPRLVFADGGHGLQKSQAIEIGQALLRWVPTLG